MTNKEMNYCDIIEINTPRLVLRKLRISDAEAFYEFASDKRVSVYMNWHTHATVLDSENSIRASVNAYEKGKYYRWGIALKENDTLIGIIQLLAFDDEKNSCGFAYMLNRDYWGNGYGTEAVRSIISFAFENMQVDVIEVDVFSENVASLKVLKRCGMIYVKTIDDKYEKNGVLHDADRYVMTRRTFLGG